LSSRRPPRAPGPRFGSNPAGGADDAPAQTNLGLLLQRALEAAQQTSEVGEAGVRDEQEGGEFRETQLCANCWNASTYKDETGKAMARCTKDLWIKASFTLEELNGNKIRRWYADCPGYDDSE